MDEDEAGTTGGIGGVETDFAAEDVGNHAADGQAKARALLERIELREALEYGLRLIGRHACARVGDGEGEAARIFGERDVEVDFALRRMLAGVREEVGDDLLDTLAILKLNFDSIFWTRRRLRGMSSTASTLYFDSSMS